MLTVQFEHPIRDFAMWKAAFDHDPINRKGLGVRRHRVSRPLDDPYYVIGELQFDTIAEAEACSVALRELWSSRRAAPALAGAPQLRIIETVDEQTYDPAPATSLSTSQEQRPGRTPPTTA
jgi:hypothetical protein